MKNKIFIYGALALATTLVSCNDLLDKDPLDRFINDPAYWSNADNVEGQCNVFYEQFTGYGNAGGSGMFYFKTLSDDQASNSFSDWDYVAVPASSSYWKNPWIEIRRANYVIQGVASSSLDSDTKKHYTGIARLMRAYEYSNLVKMYGDVQWVNHPLDVTETAILYGKRDDRDMVMDSVLQDLNYAAATIKEGTSKITWTRQMANAMKSDICLWEGTFRKYRTAADNGKGPDTEGATKFLNACVDACTYIMGKGYTLSAGAAGYHSTYNSEDLSKSTEVIFYKSYKKDIFMHSTIDYTCSSTPVNGMTKDAFDNYLFSDGKPLSTTSKNKNDAAKRIIKIKLDANGHPVKDKDGKQVIDTIMSIADVLSVRDLRLSETIDTAVYYTGMTWARAYAMQMTSVTGYGVSKYDNVTMPVDYRDQTGKNYTCCPIFWLPVVMLNYAEAKAELGTVQQSDLDNTVNKLLARGGITNGITLNPTADPANNMGVSNLLWEIRRCRRCELMFDNWFRYWDLVRWHQLNLLDSTQYPNILLGANVMNDPKKTVAVIGNYINATKGKTRVYNNKYYLYPVPSGQITLNPNLAPNNPGW